VTINDSIYEVKTCTAFSLLE